MERMMIYLWEDTDAPEIELKFGDHFTNTNTFDEAIKETRNYIKKSLGRQKHKFDEGRIVIHKIWDASEYAKNVGRFYSHAKVDDYIRNNIILGTHVSGDIHRDISADEFIIRVNKELVKHNQNLPDAGLSTLQFRELGKVLKAFSVGHKTILAEWCARFGKTVEAGAIIKETQAELTIIASYVLTSFSSFIKDFSSFNQTKDFVLIDSKDDDYKEKIKESLNNKKQVVVFLSMCNGSLREDRINFLYNIDIDILTIIDEADYGIQSPKQANALINARKENDLVLLMTGTGADKAVSNWDIDYHTSVTYIELLVEKNLEKE